MPQHVLKTPEMQLDMSTPPVSLSGRSLRLCSVSHCISSADVAQSPTLPRKAPALDAAIQRQDSPLKRATWRGTARRPAPLDSESEPPVAMHSR